MQDCPSSSTRKGRRFPAAWGSPPPTAVLESDQVQVWITSLDQGSEAMAGYLDTLEPAERARAFRFHFERDRARFIVARGTLRALLGQYLNAQPGEIRFSYNSYGKPSLSGLGADEGIRFNVSHSHDSALFAFCWNREVGVDIERIRPDFGTEQIAERFFSPGEIAALRELRPEQRVEAFFNCWTRKEAYIKARGEGLSFPLDQFDVGLAPGEPARLLCVRGEPNEALRWSMRDLDAGEEYRAAVIAEGNDWQLKRHYAA